MTIRSALILGARGGFGRLLTRHLTDAGVHCIARDREDAHDLPEAQAVFLCVPERAVVGLMPQLAGRDALFVDIASVKSAIAAAMGPVNEHLSLHPMFAPAAGFEGQNVCYIDRAGSDRSAAVLELVRGWGANLVQLASFEEHDRLTAYGQAAAHAAAIAYGLTLAEADVDRAKLSAMSTPVQRLLADAAGRIAAGDPAVYATIQQANPHAARARHKLAAELVELDAAVDEPNLRRFARLLGRLKTR